MKALYIHFVIMPPEEAGTDFNKDIMVTLRPLLHVLNYTVRQKGG
jgi:hypothetical protein